MDVALNAARKAMMEKFPLIWTDPAKLELVISDFVCSGTQHILDGDKSTAEIDACFACYFEQQLAATLNKVPNMAKVIELYNGDEHTLIKYLRKRIPCPCRWEVQRSQVHHEDGSLLQPKV